MDSKQIRYILFLGIGLVVAACHSESNNVLNIPQYEGPTQEVYDVVHYYSDSAVVKLKIDAPVQLDFEDGDSEFPKGIFIEFYDKKGEVTNTLRANYCKYDHEEKVYKATGDVVMKALKTNEQLNTEELFWNPDKEIVYTEKFVRIETEDNIIKGNGLESNQDFTEWTIKNSVGTIALDNQ